MKHVSIKNSVAEITFQYDGYDLIANVKYTYDFLPAKLTGAWENCHPIEEDFDYEIFDIGFDGYEQANMLIESERANILIEATDWLEVQQGINGILLEMVLDVYYTGLDY